MNRNHTQPTILLSIVAVALLIGGCTTKTVQTAPMLAVPVTVAKAVQKTVPINLTAIGSADAYSSVSVKAQVNAVLEQVHIQEGQFVKKGDLLFTLDARPFEAALAQAQANLARDQAQAELTDVQARRYDALYKAGVAPKEQFDQMRANADAQHAAVRADQAAVEAARLQVQYCKIYAPIAGRTGALQVYPGNIVKQNDVPVLIVINQINPIFVNFSLPEQYLGAVQKFMARGKLRVEATPYGETEPDTGYLTFVDNTVDNTTGTFKLKGTFANQNHRLWPGQFSTISLRLAQDEDATVIPSQAVQTGRSGEVVFVVKSDSTVEERPVKVARTFDGDSVISSGIQPGETVVTDGQLRLIPGIKVRVTKSMGGS
ncbi:MAG TPA: efflux RND transporter periplasmic adaptor subunit [Candidatus Polarisedimenticolia bacterium]|nr:efflux RND transporter periplasmic adaptor subunit [Candidatus Polarisedimenticolia bacterium]